MCSPGQGAASPSHPEQCTAPPDFSTLVWPAEEGDPWAGEDSFAAGELSLIHISEPTRPEPI
eukprot:7442419-Pyramimonas_sp.AAC.1